MPYTHHHKRRSDYIESPARNKRCMDSRKDSIADESLRSLCDDDADESSNLSNVISTTSYFINSAVTFVIDKIIAPSHTDDQKAASPKRPKRRPRNLNHGHPPESPSFAAQFPLPPSPSDPAFPFQHIDHSGWTQTSTSIKRYDSSAETLSQSYSGQNSPSSSRSPRRASSAAQANGVSKPYQPHRKHIRHKQHQRAVQAQKQQELLQLRMSSGQSAAEVKEFVNYAELISKLDANDAFPTSRLSLGVKPTSSQLSSSSTFSKRREELELEYRQDMLERAIRRARDALESARNPSKELLYYIAELGDICKPTTPALPASLSDSDRTEVTEALKKRGTVAKFAREQVSDRDLARLKPAQWLNDEIINFYGALIMARGEEAKKGKGKALDTHYFNTFFFAKLEDPGYEKARIGKWTKKFDIFKKDVALVPVNLGNAHWTCAAINFKKKRIEYHDSMGMKRGKVYKYLRDYLNKEHRDKKKTDFDFTGWEDYFDDDSPQQENGYDCGVFSCQYMECISRDAGFGFSQSNMTYLRQRMILEITRGKLWDQQ